MRVTPKYAIPCKADCGKMQQALANLQCWGRGYKFEFNPSQCKVPTITRNKSPLIYISVDLCELDCIFACREKYLGVCINCNLSWNDHIYTITRKANSLKEVFSFKVLCGNIDLDVYSFVVFVDNGNPLPTLKSPYYKSGTFQSHC